MHAAPGATAHGTCGEAQLSLLASSCREWPGLPLSSCARGAMRDAGLKRGFSVRATLPQTPEKCSSRGGESRHAGGGEAGAGRPQEPSTDTQHRRPGLQGAERGPGWPAGALRLAPTRAPAPRPLASAPPRWACSEWGWQAAGLGRAAGAHCHQSSTSQLPAFLGQAGPGLAHLQVPL